jgi:hypothetical protein
MLLRPAPVKVALVLHQPAQCTTGQQLLHQLEVTVPPAAGQTQQNTAEHTRAVHLQSRVPLESYLAVCIASKQWRGGTGTQPLGITIPPGHMYTAEQP